MLKNRLKALRARDGYNQTTLAKKINVSRQTISLIERGDYAPSVTIALALARLFDVTVEDIFQLEGEDLDEE
ncbi:helix-turn-helix transcriptional regulator [Halalkalibacter alkalisediminis]|uniref:Helix-turn-helix transcriptional regulator n=1 Tax=Halalkalibacter alkalisediminis TaxID=935616 RepID=A0ABV6NF64_9BACI|nr:helix-turn-helix transcriptional regulator [Halalkalibacter alkalisediminis]